MGKYWGKIIVENRIRKDQVTQGKDKLSEKEFGAMVQSLCEPMDLPRPVILSKHIKEMSKFHRTRFFADDFMEDVPFDSFEIEQLIDREKNNKV